MLSILLKQSECHVPVELSPDPPLTCDIYMSFLRQCFDVNFLMTFIIVGLNPSLT